MTYGWMGSGQRALEFPAGEAVAVSRVGRARMRYNAVTQLLEQSVNGGAYVPAGGLGATLWTRVGNDVSLVDSANNVVVGAGTVVGAERFRVVGAARIDGNVQLAGAGTNLFLGSTDGSTAAVSPAGEGRIRYNGGANQWELSANGSAYAALVGGSGIVDRVARWNATGTVAASQVTDDGVGNLGEIATMRFPAPATSAYLAGQVEVPNASGAANQVFSFGWNINAGGLPVVAGEPCLYDSWESNWLTGADRWMERHWQYRSADGLVSRRPFTMVIDRATHAPTTTVAGKFVCADETHVTTRFTILQAAAGVATAAILGDVSAACPLRFEHNGSVAIAQINAGRTAYEALLRLDATDNLQLGGGVGVVKIRLLSTIGGFVPPLKTTTQRDAMTPSTGETIYNTTTLAIESWNGAGWS